MVREKRIDFVRKCLVLARITEKIIKVLRGKRLLYILRWGIGFLIFYDSEL